PRNGHEQEDRLVEDDRALERETRPGQPVRPLLELLRGPALERILRRLSQIDALQVGRAGRLGGPCGSRCEQERGEDRARCGHVVSRMKVGRNAHYVASRRNFASFPIVHLEVWLYVLVIALTAAGFVAVYALAKLNSAVAAIRRGEDALASR